MGLQIFVNQQTSLCGDQISQNGVTPKSFKSLGALKVKQSGDLTGKCETHEVEQQQ